MPLTRYEGEETEGPERYLFLLGDGSNAEDAYLGDNGRTLTKMVLARCLQRNGALAAGESLNSAWNQTLARLEARAAAWLPVVSGTSSGTSSSKRRSRRSSERPRALTFGDSQRGPFRKKAKQTTAHSLGQVILM